MNPNNIYKRPVCRALFITVVLSLAGLVFLGSPVAAQGQPENRNDATCKIKVGNKEYQSSANERGYFSRVSGIQPGALVFIEVAYPGGKRGEKVVLAAEDGGSFDNQKLVKVVQLNDQGKCSFTFQLTSEPGIFEIFLRKGTDSNAVQLWAGKE